MDIDSAWLEYSRRTEAPSVEEKQDELQAQAVRLANATAAALKALHEHKRENGDLAFMPLKPFLDLSFWMEVTATRDAS